MARQKNEADENSIKVIAFEHIFEFKIMTYSPPSSLCPIFRIR